MADESTNAERAGSPALSSSPTANAGPHPLPVRSRTRAVIGTIGFVASLLAQLAMIVLGIEFIVTPDSVTSLGIIAGWDLVGILYTLVTLGVLGILSRRDPRSTASPSRLSLSAPARIVSFSATLFASLVGLGAATQVLAHRSDPDLGVLVNFVGVAAMLLAWGFLHWGFAQLYYQAYWSGSEPRMRFPETDTPQIVDFVYFAFTIGTTFATSDVEVFTTRIRWRVVWHSVLSFFFNGLIIVLALNTILSIGKT